VGKFTKSLRDTGIGIAWPASQFTCPIGVLTSVQRRYRITNKTSDRPNGYAASPQLDSNSVPFPTVTCPVGEASPQFSSNSVPVPPVPCPVEDSHGPCPVAKASRTIRKPMRPPYTPVVESLPATTPFVGPEALVRRTGRAIDLRLGANESPFGPSPNAVKAMQEQAAISQFYGDPECFLLRSELAAQLGVGIENISVGAGVDELLGLCCRLFVDPETPIVTTLGSYPTFDYVALACGAVFHYVRYANEALDLGALTELAKVTAARILYVANPDNPSGSWHTPEEIAELRQHLAPNCVLLLDEAYADFAPGTPVLDTSDPQVIRLRTFSKVHGMAGMRVGYVVAHADHVRALDKIRLHFGVNCVAQAGALASLQDSEHVANVVRESEKGRIELAEFFDTKGLRSLPSYTNFLTVDVGSKPRAEAILSRLLQRGVFIRKPGMPPLDGCIRVTIGRPEQRAKFAEVFEEVLIRV